MAELESGLMLGYVHLCPVHDLADGEPYAYISRRMVWKFWRWEIVAIYFDRDDDPVVGTNLTMLGAIGMLKLLGVTK